ncbi:SGNH/GDSL hydrolase family protein [Ancylobacter sonchi]|uniref:SGNH/GDSL hydrolase family protein n=1 Tax=Ancylobacter sonchi TaxID=1937790 RepID=UPI001BD56499|nr:SGNH/GDSL hydrolase family protein [Ancylobacter sonchi]MBS7537238.1 SGNH/GDSL hydrolase family protein [Ancylobacter sonchi]
MSGEIELAPQRALTHLVGHDGDGYYGRHSLAGLRALLGVVPANVADFPLRGGGEYYGQVGTNCRISTAQATDGISTFSKCCHTLRADVSELAVRMPNWMADRNRDKYETPLQSQATYSMSLEYPSGTLTNLTFNGGSQGLADMGGEVCSDFIPVSQLTGGALTVLPAGTRIWTRIAVFAATGYPHAIFGQNALASEGNTASTSRVTDLTRRFGSPDPSPRTVGVWPIGIIARTTHGGVLGIGDSIVQGTGDSYASPDGDTDGNGFGLIGRAVSTTRAYINCGMAGEALETIINSYDRRLSLARYVKNIIFEHGVNGSSFVDEANRVRTQTQMIALWTLGARYKRQGARLFQTTITPSTTSTDSFATTANQALQTGFTAGQREILNDWLRDGAPIVGAAPVATGTSGALYAGDGSHPLHAVFDVADAAESSRNSGKWKVNGAANWFTADGLHPTRAGNLAIAAAGAINTAQFA